MSPGPTKRIHTQTPPEVTVVGGGDPGGGGTGNVEWGPRFGKTDDDTFAEMVAQLDVYDTMLTGDLNPRYGIDLDHLLLFYADLFPQISVDFWNANLVGDVATMLGIDAANSNIQYIADLLNSQMATDFDLALLAGNLVDPLATDFDNAHLEGDTAVRIEQASTAVVGRMSRFTIEYMHWAKSEALPDVNDSLGFINPRQGASSSLFGAIADRTDNNYVQSGAPFTIRAPLLGNNNEVVYLKFPTYDLALDTGALVADGTSYSIFFGVELQNTGLIAANVTCDLYYSASNPWTNATADYDATAGGTLGGVLFHSETLSQPASTTSVRFFVSTQTETAVLLSNWIYARLTNNLTTDVIVSHAHSTGQPNDYPPSFTADGRPGVIAFRGLLL